MIILASASLRRAELLKRAQIPFNVIVSPAKEPHRKPAGIPIELWPMCLAYMKAIAVQKHISGGKGKHKIILAADTIVVLQSRIINKPRNRAHARQILTALNHKIHACITGICLLRGNRVRLASATAICKLHFTPRQLQAYLDSNLWKGKAGAYGIQDASNKTDPFVTLLSGDMTTVIGLPLPLLQSELASFARN